jgi:hypothetical protein
MVVPQIAFELHAFMVLGNMQFVAGGEPAALDSVRRAVDTRLAALAPGVAAPSHLGLAAARGSPPIQRYLRISMCSTLSSRSR